MKLFDLFQPILDLGRDEDSPRGPVRALHSGNIGDVIYSLPTAFSLGATHFILNICSDPAFAGRVMTRDAALKVAPLLLGQGGIRRVSVIQTQIPFEYADPRTIGVDLVLDAFRVTCADPHSHLIHRHALPFGIRVDGSKRWLQSEPCRESDLPEGIRSPYIVVSLTKRWRRWDAAYYASLLRDVPPENLIFVGVEEDLIHKTQIPGAFLKPADFTQLARILTGAALFIGNPSFPYALAESLKVPRLIELPEWINVAPLDASGLALHLHSETALRTRIFDALDLQPPEIVTLKAQIELLDSQIKTLEAENHSLLSLHSRIEGLESLNRQLQETVTHRTAEGEELAHRVDQLEREFESPGYLFKCLFRKAMLSNRLSASLHVSLSHNPTLRRIWRSVGQV